MNGEMYPAFYFALMIVVFLDTVSKSSNTVSKSSNYLIHPLPSHLISFYLTAV